jgi:hypothetical protein
MTEVSISSLPVSRADEVVLLIAAVTDYQGFAGRQTRDLLAVTRKKICHAANKAFVSLQKTHVADYAKYFQRLSLQLGMTRPEVSGQPTPAQIHAIQAGATDSALAALLSSQLVQPSCSGFLRLSCLDERSADVRAHCQQSYATFPFDRSCAPGIGQPVAVRTAGA